MTKFIYAAIAVALMISSSLMADPPTPSNFVGTQVLDRFLFQTDLINLLSWDPAVDPTVISYKIRRNFVQIAQILVTQPTTYEDHNRVAGQIDLYELIAVDNVGGESLPAVITVP